MCLCPRQQFSPVQIPLTPFLAMSGEDAPIDLKAQCLCKAFTFTTPISKADLPLKASTCHCTSCRHVTGALYSSDAPWPGDHSEIAQSSLTEYVFTERVSVLFCGTCSSPMFFQEKATASSTDLTYGVFSGVLANLDVRGLVEFKDHIFVGDTLDGGATPWLCSLNGEGKPEVARWMECRGNGEALTHDWPQVKSLPNAADVSGLDEIPLRCRCKGVDFVLRNPVKEFSGNPKEELPWFIDPVTRKALAGFDPCDSCRLSSGVDIFHWTFALLKQITFPGGDALPASTTDLKAALSAPDSQRDARYGTLTYYASSPDVQRYFCSRCSACVFYAVDSRPDMVDIALGVLDSPDGARAEGFCSWAYGGHMVNRGNAAGGWREELIQRIESEGEKWRIQRGYPKCWLRIAREAALAKAQK